MHRLVLLLSLLMVLAIAFLPLYGQRNISITRSYNSEAEGKTAEAIDIMLQLEKSNPQEPFYKLRLGWLYFSIRNYEKAGQYYRESLQLHKSPEAREGLMNTHYYRAEWAKTVETGQDILTDFPHNFNVLTAVAYSYYALTDFTQAALYYRKAAELYPYNLEVMGYLLSSYHLSGEVEKAGGIYQKLVRYNPENYFIKAYQEFYSK